MERRPAETRAGLPASLRAVQFPRAQRAPFNFHRALSSPESLNFFGGLVGVRPQFRHTLYMQGVCVVRYGEGDFSCPHNDVQEDRIAAFILYLTDSEPGDGGEFVWCTPGSLHAPARGTLALLRMRGFEEGEQRWREASEHFVYPVSNRSRVQGRMVRTTITGWLATKNKHMFQFFIRGANEPDASTEVCGWGGERPHPKAAGHAGAGALVV